MQKIIFFTSVFALVSAFCGPARAADEIEQVADQDAATTIEAARLEIHLDRRMKATGAAEMHINGEAIFGDRIDYDQLNQLLHASGNVRVEQKGNVIAGPELKMQLDQRVGEMQEAVFTLGGKVKIAPMTQTSATPQQINAPQPDDSLMQQARGKAALLSFDGPSREILKNASYTTCEAGRDDWYLNAREMELDHYTQVATATHASIEFKGVPILYTPWMDFPLSRQRQSGFLTPTWATTSSSGLDITLPYYWNISPNRDATISGRYMSLHGVQTQGEFRYLEENYKGQDHLEYLPNDSTGVGTRYYVNLLHDQIFGGGWSGGLNYQKVSDDKYFTDLSSSIITTSTVVMPQQAYVNYGDGTWNFNGLVQKFQTLDGASYPYQQLPQLTLSGHKDWDLFNGNLYTQWVNFERSSQALSTAPLPSAPGTTLLSGVNGGRSTIYPSLSMPLGNSYGYVTPKFGVDYTKYDLSNSRYTLKDALGHTTAGNFVSDSRTLPIFSLDSDLYFDRDFKVIKNAYTQTLEPRLYYVYIPYQDQSQLPVFDTAQSDINLGTLFTENQFTGGDRINNANQLSLAVTSRIIDATTGVQRMAVTLGERFYFSDQKVTLPNIAPRTENTSDIVLAGTARLLNHLNIDTGWQYNTGAAQIDQANIGARYNPEPGKVLNLSYRYTRAPQGIQGVNQVDLSTEWPLGGNWFGLGRLNYSFYRDPKVAGGVPGMVESLGGIEYDAGCWQARVVAQLIATPTTATAANPTPSAGLSRAIFFQLVLTGLAPLGTASPIGQLNRSIPGYRDSALMPNNLQ